MKKLLASLLVAVWLPVHAGDFAVTIGQSLPGAFFNYLLVLATSDTDDWEDVEPTTVMASGTGDTCNDALINAKMHALEKVNGSWVSSERLSKNGSYSEEIVEYSGGVIKNWEYVKDDCKFVIIKADIVPRKNKVLSSKAKFSNEQLIHINGIIDAEDHKQKAIIAINVRSKALHFEPEKTEFVVINNKEVGVKVHGKLSFQPKWRDDYKELRQRIGYFNLSSFEPDPTFYIVGKEAGEVTFQTSFTYDGKLKLWDQNLYGVTLHTHKSEDVIVKFRVPVDKLKRIKYFEVKIL